MAKIAGITIEFGADASGLEKSIKDIDESLKKTQSNLRQVDKLLKFNPSSTDLLVQKQKALKDAVTQTEKRLEGLKEAQSQVAEGTPEWEALQQEIVVTEQKLKNAEKELRNFGSVTSQQLKAAGQKMKDFGGKVTNVGRELSKISGAAAGALAGLAKIGVTSMKSADELNTLSKQTGLSTEELQKWSYASELVDVSVESMTGAMKKMKKGMDSNSDAFESLGVATKDADGNFRSATDVFYDTLAALSNIDNETERDIKAMEIFGKSADELAGIIDDGGAALREYGEEAKEAGLIMSQDMVDDLNAANDEMDKMKKNVQMSLGQLGGTLLKTFGPAIQKVAGFIGTLTEKLRALSPEQAEMIVKVLGIVAIIGPLVMGIGKVISIIGGLVSGIGAIVGVLGGPLTIAIAAAIAIGVLLWKNWDKIKAFAIKVADAVKAAWENLKAGVVNAATAVKDGVVNAWNALKSGVTSAMSAVGSFVTSKWNTIKSTVTSISNAIKSVVTSAWNGIKSAISNAISGVKGQIEAFKTALNTVKTAAQTVVDKIKSIFSGTISFPHIKLPHFSVYGGEAPYGLGGVGSLPKISIDWYKKAYENPVMFTSPTVLPTAAGLKGFGDGSGAEIVMSLEKLQELVGAQNNKHVVVEVTLEGDARGLFKVVQKTNHVRTKATNYNALAVGG